MPKRPVEMPDGSFIPWATAGVVYCRQGGKRVTRKQQLDNSYYCPLCGAPDIEWERDMMVLTWAVHVREEGLQIELSKFVPIDDIDDIAPPF